jgi:hypothetical protein
MKEREGKQMETKEHASDVTFQASGPMTVFFRNDIDQYGGVYNGTRYGGTGIDPIKASLHYLPVEQPPPRWIQNSDWSVPSYPGVFPYLVMPSRMGQGSVAPLSINERGPKKVVPGASYVFDQPITPGTYTLISLHFNIVGVEGGSTIAPGFGLYNLITHPNAWTYIYPLPGEFTGGWSVQLRTVDGYDLLTLKVSYVRAGIVMGFGDTSRLCYEVSGSQFVANPTPNKATPDAAPPPHAEQEPALLEIHSAPSTYLLASY